MELPKSSCVISSRRLCPSLGHGRVLRHLGLFLALRHGRALLHWHAKLCIARLVSVSVQKSSYVGHFGVSAHPPVKAGVPCNLGQSRRNTKHGSIQVTCNSGTHSFPIDVPIAQWSALIRRSHLPLSLQVPRP